MAITTSTQTAALFTKVIGPRRRRTRMATTRGKKRSGMSRRGKRGGMSKGKKKRR
tara:strand:- start:8928 stop:9092 length:165 start_codon:yes stop_codon:yes gene_type:complete